MYMIVEMMGTSSAMILLDDPSRGRWRARIDKQVIKIRSISLRSSWLIRQPDKQTKLQELMSPAGGADPLCPVAANTH